MQWRTRDPVIWLNAAIAGAFLVTSLFVHSELGDRATRSAQVAAEATTAEAAVLFDAQLEQVLAATRAVASAPTALERETLALRNAGIVTSVIVVGPDLTTERDFTGQRAEVVSLSVPGASAAAAAARDTGDPRLGDFAGSDRIVAVAPIYRGAPVGTEARRDSIDGFVVASVDADRTLASSLPGDAQVSARLFARGVPLAEHGGARRGPGDNRAVTAGGITFTIAVTGAPADRPIPVFPVVALALAAAGWAVGAHSIRRRRRAEDAAGARAAEIGLLADLGSLLQQSLNLEEILPAAMVRLSRDLDLEACGVMRVDRSGQLVQAFTLGIPPATELEVLNIPYAPPVIGARTEAFFPLQRAGRVSGVLWVRPRTLLDQPRVRSLTATSDLLAAAIANTEAYERERDTVRRLEELDRIKNQFIGTVSHEMRTSASAVCGFTNLLEANWENLADAQRHEFVVRTRRNAESLVNIVEDFLDFSRLERHSPAVEVPVQSLSALVESVLGDLRALTTTHHLEARITPGVLARADRPAIERILTNLVSNAVKYSPGAGCVTVIVESSGAEAVLAVEDEGPGIPLGDRARVFEAFYRSNTEATAGTRGAGIGLAVVKEIADRLRARTFVGDSPAGGARVAVAFTVPRPSVPSPALTTGGTHGQ
jgi:signal transduction histidine kinase